MIPWPSNTWRYNSNPRQHKAWEQCSPEVETDPRLIFSMILGNHLVFFHCRLPQPDWQQAPKGKQAQATIESHIGRVEKHSNTEVGTQGPFGRLVPEVRSKANIDRTTNRHSECQGMACATICMCARSVPHQTIKFPIHYHRAALLVYLRARPALQSQQQRRQPWSRRCSVDLPKAWLGQLGQTLG